MEFFSEALLTSVVLSFVVYLFQRIALKRRVSTKHIFIDIAMYVAIYMVLCSFWPELRLDR